MRRVENATSASPPPSHAERVDPAQIYYIVYAISVRRRRRRGRLRRRASFVPYAASAPRHHNVVVQRPRLDEVRQMIRVEMRLG